MQQKFKTWEKPIAFFSLEMSSEQLTRIPYNQELNLMILEEEEFEEQFDKFMKLKKFLNTTLY